MIRTASHRYVVLVSAIVAVTVALLTALSPVEAYAAGSWKAQTSGTTGELHSVAFTDATHGWAVGDDGILATTDGGTTWVAEDTGRSGFTSVVFVDATHGWAAGGGTLLSTTDGGAHWTLPTERTWNWLSSVFFIDKRHGWVATHSTDCPVAVTTDSGGIWAVQMSANSAASIESVFFVDAEHGWIAGDGMIEATTDGGEHWVWQDANTGGHSIFFTDTKHGWAVGLNGTILATTDGGATWTKQESGTTNYLNAVSFLDARHGWVVGQSGTILTTIDGGETWTAQSAGSASAQDLNSVSFTDSTHGWAVGSNGTTLVFNTAAQAVAAPRSDGAVMLLAAGAVFVLVVLGGIGMALTARRRKRRSGAIHVEGSASEPRAQGPEPTHSGPVVGGEPARFCAGCGSRVASGAAFCASCGASVVR